MELENCFNCLVNIGCFDWVFFGFEFFYCLYWVVIVDGYLFFFCEYCFFVFFCNVEGFEVECSYYCEGIVNFEEVDVFSCYFCYFVGFFGCDFGGFEC